MSATAINPDAFWTYLDNLSHYVHEDETYWEGFIGHCVNYSSDGLPVAVLRIRQIHQYIITDAEATL